ncbi:MAG: DUF2189 domain-containing protein [Mangrovicoccus sp.]
MPSFTETTDLNAPAASPAPVIKPITQETIKACLHQGFEDFKTAPSYGLFFGAVYAIGGLVLYIIARGLGMSFIALPLALIFPLIGPFVAIGLYEVSRRLHAKEELTWPAVLGVLFSQRHRQLPYIGAIMVFMVMIWLVISRLTFAVFLGNNSIINFYSSMDTMLTLDGLTMILVNIAVGASVAFLLFAITVISIPMLMEREMDFVTAMITSFEFVTENLVPMLTWGAAVIGLLLVAMLPAFLGLIVVLPVLGHATWHLYRAAVE